MAAIQEAILKQFNSGVLNMYHHIFLGRSFTGKTYQGKKEERNLKQCKQKWPCKEASKHGQCDSNHNECQGFL